MNFNKAILKDPVFILLFINSALVLLAYSYNSYNGYISSNFTLAKQGVILLSLIFLLSRKFSLRIFQASVFLVPVFFLLFSLFRASFFGSLYSLSTLFVPYFYIILSLGYLVPRFGFKEIFGHIALIINVIYLYPVLVYFGFGTGFEQTNIYGLQDQGLFYSNHYGWASAIFLTSAPAVLYLFRLHKIHRFILLGSMVLAFYLIIISANRASLLALGLAIATLLLFRRGINLLKGANLGLLPFLVLIPVLFYFSLAEKKDSSIQFLLAKNEKQFETKELKESRLVVSEFAFGYYNEKPELWLSGVGLFNHDFLAGADSLGAFHNSYWEILFGGGIFIFLLFLNIMVFRPASVYFKYIGNYGLFIIPLIIIPFFESNLTGGQFLFFPWFTSMLLLNVRKIQ